MEINNDLIKDDDLVVEDITPKEMLIFAKSILLGLSILFALGAICEIFKPEIHIFEACKNILPPIAGIVIGYYFGKS